MLVATFVAFLAAANSLSSAATFTITTADGTGADSAIINTGGSSSTTNYGGDNNVTIKFLHNIYGITGSAIWSQKAYLRFDLDAAGVSAAVDTASLDLDFIAVNNLGQPRQVNVFGLTDGHGDENWLENTITWSNAPANDVNSVGGAYTTPGTAGVTSDAIFLGTYDMAAGNGVHSLSNQNLVDFLNADTNGIVTFILTASGIDAADVNQQIVTKEGVGDPYNLGNIPTLNVTTIPEPASVALFAAGLIGTIVRRRVRM